MKQDLKGIRKRGNAYQYNVSYNGQRVVGSVSTLAEAIKERENALKLLKGQKPTTPPEGSVEKTKQTSSSSIAVAALKKANLKSLKAMFDITVISRWGESKGAKAAIINGQAAVNFFGERTHIADITPERIREYMGHLESKGNSNGTINRKLSALSMVIKTAEEYGHIEQRPVIRRKKEYKGRERFVTLEEENEMLRLLEAWGLYDFRDAIITLIDTGFRCGELLGLLKVDVNFSAGKNGIITLWRTKTDKPRSVPITQRVKELMQRRIDTASKDQLFPYQQAWIRHNWDRMKQHMGLEDDAQFVPHILRHTCASRLVQNGIPLPMVQAWMGHSSMQSTIRYSHLAPTSLYNVVDALEKIG